MPIECSPFIYKGVYNNYVQYEPGNIVFHQGSSYINRVSSIDILPTDPTRWGRLTQLTFRGEYDFFKEYFVGDIVSNSEKTRLYMCISEPSKSNLLTSDVHWFLIVDVAGIVEETVVRAENAAQYANEQGSYALEQGQIVSTIVCDILDRIAEINGIIHEVNLLKEEWDDAIRPGALQAISAANTATQNAYVATSAANIAAYSTIIIYKLPVATYADIAITYPEPENGWLVQVVDEQKFYRYNGLEEDWELVQNIDLSMAVAKTGDTMTGDLNVNANINVQNNLSVSGNEISIGNRFKIVRNMDYDSLDIELVN